MAESARAFQGRVQVNVDAIDRSRDLAQVYENYAEAVQRYIFARVGNVAEVEDLTSVTFLHVAAHLDSYRPEKGALTSWLFAIARNVVGDYVRQVARHPRSVPMAESVADWNPGPEEICLRSERPAALRRGFGAITDDQRDAVALRFLAELSFAEIGMAMGRSEAAAKMLVQRALLGLRHHLAMEADDDAL